MQEKNKRTQSYKEKNQNVAEHCVLHKKTQEYAQAGITLVALVVTIIVLLILAGVTIRLVLDNNGIIHNTRLAALKSEMARIIEDGDMAIANIQTDKLRQGDMTLTLDEVVSEMNDNFGYNGRIQPIDDEGNITSITAVNPLISDLEVNGNKVITITPTTGGSAYYVQINGLYYKLSLNNGKLVINDNGSTYENLTGGGEYTLTATSNNTDYVTVTGTNPSTRTVTLKGIASTKNLQAKPQITISYGKAGGQTVSTTVTVNVLGKYTVTVVAGENGTVSPSGEQQVTEGQSITVTATGNTGETNYKFKSWSDGTTTYTTSSTWEYTPTGNITLTAEFEEIREPKIGIFDVDENYIQHFGKTVSWSGIDAEEEGKWRLFYADVNGMAYLIRDSIGNIAISSLSSYKEIVTDIDLDLAKNLNPKIKSWPLNDERIKIVASLTSETATEWSKYKTTIPGVTMVIGGPTVEMFVKSYNATHNEINYNKFQVGRYTIKAENDKYGDSRYLVGINTDGGEVIDSKLTSDGCNGLGNTATLDRKIYCPSTGCWNLISPAKNGRIMAVSKAGNGFFGDSNYSNWNGPAGIRPIVSVPISKLGNLIILETL